MLLFELGLCIYANYLVLLILPLLPAAAPTLLFCSSFLPRDKLVDAAKNLLISLVHELGLRLSSQLLSSTTSDNEFKFFVLFSLYIEHLNGCC